MDGYSIIRPDRLVSLLALSFTTVFLIPFEADQSGFFVPLLVIAAAVAALLSGLGYAFDLNGRGDRMPVGSAAVLALAALSGASFMWSADKGATLGMMPSVLMAASAYWAASRMVPKARQAAIFIITTAASAMLAVTFMIVVKGAVPDGNWGAFAFADMRTYAAFAIAINALSVRTLQEMLRGEGLRTQEASTAVRWFLGLGSALMVALSAAAAATASRAAVVFILFIWLASAVFAPKGRKATQLAVTAVLAAAGLAAAYFAYGDAAGVASVLKGFLPGLSEELAAGSYHWLLGARLVLAKPVAGVGAGAFAGAMPSRYFPGPVPATGTPYSFLVRTAAELGMAGFLLLGAAAAHLALSHAANRRRSSEGTNGVAFAAASLACWFLISDATVPGIVLLAVMGGYVAADAVKEINGVYVKRKITASAAAFLLLAIVTAAAGVWSMAAVQAKEEALHHAGHSGGEGAHDTYAEALEGIEGALRLYPYDEELMYEAARLSMAVASHEGGGANEAYESALRLAKAHPYSVDSMITMANAAELVGKDEWTYIRKAAEYAAGDPYPSAMLMSDALKTGRFDEASADAHRFLKERRQLLQRAGTGTIEAAITLSRTTNAAALAYVAFVKEGDTAGEHEAADFIRELYGKHDAVREHIAKVLGSYGIEAP